MPLSCLGVYNKCDLLGVSPIFRERGLLPENVLSISAATGEGIDELLLAIERLVHQGKREREFLIPYTDGSALNTLHRMATVVSEDYEEQGTRVRAVVDSKVAGMLAAYLTEETE